PVRVAGQRAEKLDALPAGIAARRRIGRSPDEVDFALEHQLGALLGVVDELDVDAFLLEVSELNSGNRHEIGWGVQVRDPDMKHALASSIGKAKHGTGWWRCQSVHAIRKSRPCISALAFTDGDAWPILRATSHSRAMCRPNVLLLRRRRHPVLPAEEHGLSAENGR